jgi:MGT family glycosyltransferase
MASVVFLCDLYAGHIIPTFGLANDLVNRGHRVHYLVTPDAEELVRANGFAYRLVFEEFYPKGYMHQAKENDSRHYKAMLEGCLDGVMGELQPDLMVTSFFLSFDALLLHYRYDFPQVIFNPHFRMQINSPESYCKNAVMQFPGDVIQTIVTYFQRRNHGLGSVEDIIAPIRQFPELIACPRELDLPENQYEEKVHYLGPGICRLGNRAAEPVAVPPGKQILFASMGSQPNVQSRKSRFFFHKMLELMRHGAEPDWHLVLVTCGKMDLSPFGPVPPNVTVVEWVNQLDMLGKSSLALVHGGLGTVKECIYSGVPMVVFPRTREMAENADRVAHRKLGVKADIEQLSVKTLGTLIRSVLSSREIAQQVRQMQEIFREKEREQAGVKLIEACIGRLVTQPGRDCSEAVLSR